METATPQVRKEPHKIAGAAPPSVACVLLLIVERQTAVTRSNDNRGTCRRGFFFSWGPKDEAFTVTLTGLLYSSSIYQKYHWNPFLDCLLFAVLIVVHLYRVMGGGRLFGSLLSSVLLGEAESLP